MIAIDTNLLIYAHRSAVPEHAASREAIERAASSSRGWGFAAATIAEFWSVVTHPAGLGRPSQPDEARDFVLSLVEDGGARLWQPGPGFGARLLQAAADQALEGTRIFDLQIALTVFDNGATEIWTHDRAFSSIPGLAVNDPLR